MNRTRPIPSSASVPRGASPGRLRSCLLLGLVLGAPGAWAAEPNKQAPWAELLPVPARTPPTRPTPAQPAPCQPDSFIPGEHSFKRADPSSGAVGLLPRQPDVLYVVHQDMEGEGRCELRLRSLKRPAQSRRMPLAGCEKPALDQVTLEGR